jgi:hypothetical protein
VIVIADAGPLIALAKVDALPPELCDRVIHSLQQAA